MLQCVAEADEIRILPSSTVLSKGLPSIVQAVRVLLVRSVWVKQPSRVTQPLVLAMLVPVEPAGISRVAVLAALFIIQ